MDNSNASSSNAINSNATYRNAMNSNMTLAKTALWPQAQLVKAIALTAYSLMYNGLGSGHPSIKDLPVGMQQHRGLVAVCSSVTFFLGPLQAGNLLPMFAQGYNFPDGAQTG